MPSEARAVPTIAAILSAVVLLSACASAARSVPAGTTSTAVTPAAATPTAAGPGAGKLGPGDGTWTTRVVAVTGDATTTRRSIAIFTPPVPDPDALPVVYLLHGLPGTADDLCNPAAAASLMSAFRAGIEPFVLACPDGNPASTDDSEWADSADGRTLLETFVTTEAIQAVEGAHRRPRTMRAIAGFSMGGFGAAAIALRHPSLYSQVASFAGYFHLDDPDHVFGTSAECQAAHDPTALVAGAVAFRWFLDEAADDDAPLTAHDSERYAALLRGVGATVQVAITPGGHSPAWVIAELPRTAAFLSAGWLRPASPTAGPAAVGVPGAGTAPGS